MALSISGNLIIDEEFRSPSTGTNTENEVAALSADPALITYLNGLNANPDDGFPQYAERDDMIVGFANGATLSLVSNTDGDPFPATGVPTTFNDIDGNLITLFADPTNSNIILGKDINGEVSFAVVLDGVKVYIVQFEALEQTITGAVDTADTLDLTGLIFVQATSTVTTELDFSDFRDVPSGQLEFAMLAPDTAPPGQEGALQFLATGVAANGTHSTVNVSTQGGFNGSLGTGSQATGVGESLIFDLVTGGDTTISNTEAHDAAFIDFTNHATNIQEAGFGIVQTNPNNASVDVLLTAYNVKAASDTTDGAAFITASLDPATQDLVTITSVKITNNLGVVVADTSTNIANVVTFNADGTVTLNNLKDDWLVEFTTDEPLDRFVTKNVGTGNEQFDIGRLSATISSSETVNEYADLGAHLIYEDDGPLATLAIKANQFVVVDESIGQNAGEDETASLGSVTVAGAVLFTSTIDAGADQLDPAVTSFALSLGGGDGTDSGLNDTATGQSIVLLQVSDTLVEGHVGTTAGALAFSVSINSSGDVTLTVNRAVVHNDPNDPDEPGASAATFSPGALLATESVADNDTDPATSNAVDLGLILRLEDDGPSISTPANSIVSFSAGSSSGDVAITDSFGSDGAGAVSLVDLPSGWVFDNAAHTSASLTVDGVKQFEIVVDNDSYNFTTLVNPVLEFQPLNFAAIASGGPQETLSVPTTSTTDNTVIEFNGLLFTNFTDPTDDANNPGLASALDDLNPNNVGFGVKDGQASQINNNEGFFAQNTDAATEINGIRFDIAGIGNVETVTVEYWFVDEGVVSAPVTQTVNLPNGNQVYDNFTIHSDTSVDQIYVRFFFDGDPTNKGVRVLNFETEVALPVPDQVFDFGLQVTDGDLDSAATTTNFLIGVDGTDPDNTVAGVVV